MIKIVVNAPLWFWDLDLLSRRASSACFPDDKLLKLANNFVNSDRHQAALIIWLKKLEKATVLLQHATFFKLNEAFQRLVY